MDTLRHLAFTAVALCLSACVASEELMIGQGQPLTAPGGTKVPNNPALVAAMAGNKVYRYRQLLLGGDHIIKTSNGSEYNHALTASLKDFLQTLGIAYTAWTTLQWQLAQVAYDKFLAGEITKREAAKQMFEIDKIKVEQTPITVPNPNDGIIE